MLSKCMGQTNKGCPNELTNGWMMDRWLDKMLFGVKLQEEFIQKIVKLLGLVVHTYSPSTQKQRQQDLQFKAVLNRVRPFLQTQKPQQTNTSSSECWRNISLSYGHCDPSIQNYVHPTSPKLARINSPGAKVIEIVAKRCF